MFLGRMGMVEEKRKKWLIWLIIVIFLVLLNIFSMDR